MSQYLIIAVRSDAFYDDSECVPMVSDSMNKAKVIAQVCDTLECKKKDIKHIVVVSNGPTSPLVYMSWAASAGDFK